MIVFFPTPYEDELLYSVLARYHIRHGNTSVLTTVDDIYGSRGRGTVASVDLPCNLEGLISNMPVLSPFTFDNIVRNYSLFPVYEPFWDSKRADTILELMKEKSSLKVHAKAGAYSASSGSWKFIRFCPKCFEEDIEKYGEPYWHRLHQIAGLHICPKHKELIQNSTIPVYGFNSFCYYPASRNNCICDSKIHSYSNLIIDKMVKLAEEVKWLLNNNFCNKRFDWVQKTYVKVLKGQDLISKKGYVDQKELTSRFIEYHTNEFLEILNLSPDTCNNYRWLTALTRKTGNPQHPIKHILLIELLVGSLQEFFKINNEERIFEEGPYPCLNKAANHYLEPVINEMSIRYSRNKNPIATFSCSCGFVYERKGPDINPEDKYKYMTITSYGDEWERKLRDLIECKHMHLRKVAKELNTDLSTIRNYVVKLNLDTQWMSEESKIIMKNAFAQTSKKKEVDTDLRNEYRTKWINLMKEHEGVSKSQLGLIDKQTYNWLHWHDKEWVGKNTPVYKKQVRTTSKVNWEKRDKEEKEKVRVVVERLLNTEGRPIRISSSRIGKELGLAFLLQTRVDKLPLTKEYLEMVCESIEEYRIRRIKWAAEQIENRGERVIDWKIRHMCGLFEVNTPAIDAAIKSEVDKRSRV